MKTTFGRQSLHPACARRSRKIKRKPFLSSTNTINSSHYSNSTWESSQTYASGTFSFSRDRQALAAERQATRDSNHERAGNTDGLELESSSHGHRYGNKNNNSNRKDDTYNRHDRRRRGYDQDRGSHNYDPSHNRHRHHNNRNYDNNIHDSKNNNNMDNASTNDVEDPSGKSIYANYSQKIPNQSKYTNNALGNNSFLRRKREAAAVTQNNPQAHGISSDPLKLLPYEQLPRNALFSSTIYNNAVVSPHLLHSLSQHSELAEDIIQRHKTLQKEHSMVVDEANKGKQFISEVEKRTFQELLGLYLSLEAMSSNDGADRENPDPTVAPGDILQILISLLHQNRIVTSRQQIASSYVSLLRQKWPTARGSMFGSLVTGLASPTADCDVSLTGIAPRSAVTSPDLFTSQSRLKTLLRSLDEGGLAMMTWDQRGLFKEVIASLDKDEDGWSKNNELAKLLEHMENAKRYAKKTAPINNTSSPINDEDSENIDESLGSENSIQELSQIDEIQPLLREITNPIIKKIEDTFTGFSWSGEDDVLPEEVRSVEDIYAKINGNTPAALHQLQNIVLDTLDRQLLLDVDDAIVLKDNTVGAKKPSLQLTTTSKWLQNDQSPPNGEDVQINNTDPQESAIHIEFDPYNMSTVDFDGSFNSFPNDQESTSIDDVEALELNSDEKHILRRHQIYAQYSYNYHGPNYFPISNPQTRYKLGSKPLYQRPTSKTTLLLTTTPSIMQESPQNAHNTTPETHSSWAAEFQRLTPTQRKRVHKIITPFLTYTSEWSTHEQSAPNGNDNGPFGQKKVFQKVMQFEPDYNITIPSLPPQLYRFYCLQSFIRRQTQKLRKDKDNMTTLHFSDNENITTDDGVLLNLQPPFYLTRDKPLHVDQIAYHHRHDVRFHTYQFLKDYHCDLSSTPPLQKRLRVPLIQLKHKHLHQHHFTRALNWHWVVLRSWFGMYINLATSSSGRNVISHWYSTYMKSKAMQLMVHKQKFQTTSHNAPIFAKPSRFSVKSKKPLFLPVLSSIDHTPRMFLQGSEAFPLAPLPFDPERPQPPPHPQTNSPVEPVTHSKQISYHNLEFSADASNPLTTLAHPRLSPMSTPDIALVPTIEQDKTLALQISTYRHELARVLDDKTRPLTLPITKPSWDNVHLTSALLAPNKTGPGPSFEKQLEPASDLFKRINSTLRDNIEMALKLQKSDLTHPSVMSNNPDPSSIPQICDEKWSQIPGQSTQQYYTLPSTSPVLNNVALWIAVKYVTFCLLVKNAGISTQSALTLTGLKSFEGTKILHFLHSKSKNNKEQPMSKYQQSLLNDAVLAMSLPPITFPQEVIEKNSPMVKTIVSTTAFETNGDSEDIISVDIEDDIYAEQETELNSQASLPFSDGEPVSLGITPLNGTKEQSSVTDKQDKQDNVGATARQGRTPVYLPLFEKSNLGTTVLDAATIPPHVNIIPKLFAEEVAGHINNHYEEIDNLPSSETDLEEERDHTEQNLIQNIKKTIDTMSNLSKLYSYDPYRVKEIHFDLSFNNDTGVLNSALLKEYNAIDPRVQPMILLVKQWSQKAQIHGATNGHFSSYAYSLLTIFYLQQVGILPALQRYHTVAEDCKDYYGNDTVNTKSVHWTFQNTYNGYALSDDFIGYGCRTPELKDMSITDLFTGFLDYYSKFDFTKHVVSIREGRPISKEYKNNYHWPSLHHHRLSQFQPLTDELSMASTLKMSQSQASQLDLPFDDIVLENLQQSPFARQANLTAEDYEATVLRSQTNENLLQESGYDKHSAVAKFPLATSPYFYLTPKEYQLQQKKPSDCCKNPWGFMSIEDPVDLTHDLSRHTPPNFGLLFTSQCALSKDLYEKKRIAILAKEKMGEVCGAYGDIEDIQLTLAQKHAGLYSKFTNNMTSWMYKAQDEMILRQLALMKTTDHSSPKIGKLSDISNGADDFVDRQHLYNLSLNSTGLRQLQKSFFHKAHTIHNSLGMAEIHDASYLSTLEPPVNSIPDFGANSNRSKTYASDGEPIFTGLLEDVESFPIPSVQKAYYAILASGVTSINKSNQDVVARARNWGSMQLSMLDSHLKHDGYSSRGLHQLSDDDDADQELALYGAYGKARTNIQRNRHTQKQMMEQQLHTRVNNQGDPQSIEATIYNIAVPPGTDLKLKKYKTNKTKRQTQEEHFRFMEQDFDEDGHLRRVATPLSQNKREKGDKDHKHKRRRKHQLQETATKM